MAFPLLVAAAVGCCGVAGVVHSTDGAALRAHVHLAGPRVADADTDAGGAFTLTVPEGSYHVIVSASGYAATETDVVVHDGERIDVGLDPLGGGRLREIGRVVVDGRLSLPGTTVPSREIGRADLDAMGFDRVVDALAHVPSLTLARPNGGAGTAPVLIALRGPDPSETRITLDGQKLNNTNTGDLDLALFPASVLSAVDVSEGLGPEDHRGADTIGGEVNLISLRPTAVPQRMLRFSAGSFGTTSVDVNATGHPGRFGYALAAGSARSDGYVRDFPVVLDNAPAVLGSGISATTALANFTYDLSPRSTLRIRSLTVDDRRDESAALTAPADPSHGAPGDVFVGAGAQTRRQNLRATLVGVTAPLGAGTLSATTSFSSLGTSIVRDPAADLSLASTPLYDFSLVDRLGTSTLEWTRAAGSSSLAFGAEIVNETLASPDQGFLDTLHQHQSSAWLRASTDVMPRVRVGASVVRSNWSTFGASTDGRLGIMVGDGNGGNYRFAVGTGFRAPLLGELAVLPVSALVPDANCVGGNGNAHEHAEHATEYELGYAKRFAATTVDAALYRTNLRDPIENFYPLGTTCPLDPFGNPIGTVVAQAFPVNVGSVVYQGGSLRIGHRFGALFASAEYGVNAAYPTSLPDAVSANPTSGSNLTVGQQFSGIPLQVASLALRYERAGIHGGLDFTVKSGNNELAQGRFATLDAAVGRRFGRTDVTLVGTNLTNAVSGRFTQLGRGTVYPTPFGNEPQNALVLQPAALRLIIVLR